MHATYDQKITPYQPPYTYSTLPRPLHYNTKSYDIEVSKPFYGNIMYDKRVIRGNTWALRRMAGKQAEIDAEAEERKKLTMKRNTLRKELVQYKRNIQDKIYSHFAARPPHSSNIEKESQLPSAEIMLIADRQFREDQLAGDGQLDNFDPNVDGESTHRSDDQLLDDIGGSSKYNIVPSAASPRGSADVSCQADVNATTVDVAIQSEDDDDMNLLNEGDSKLALRRFVDSILVAAVDELEQETRVNRLDNERTRLLAQKERDLQTLRNLVVELKTVKDQKDHLMTRIDDLERENLKLVTRRVASEIVDALVGDGLSKLSQSGFFKQPAAVAEEVAKVEHLEENNNNVIQMTNVGVGEQEEGDQSSLLDVQKTLGADFLPWLNGRVWVTGSQKIMSKLLDDAIKLRVSYCRSNAKTFLQSMLDNFDENVWNS